MASRSHGTSAHDEDCVCTRCVGIKAGKALALRHGSYPSISAKRAAQLAAEVRETAPVYEDADEPVVRLLALTLARVEVATKAIGRNRASSKIRQTRK